MNVKTDTKEKFTVISPQEALLTANMTEELFNMLLPYQQKDIPNIVFNMSAVNDVEEKAGEALAGMQQNFYENNCSFVICGLSKGVEEKLDTLALLEIMNVTPTESEACDIVQMEEIEREFLKDDH